VSSISKQLDALKLGFNELISADKCALLSGVEFELLLVGLQKVGWCPSVQQSPRPDC
jgi:hypothetical protein